jgi:hypothetical protein
MSTSTKPQLAYSWLQWSPNIETADRVVGRIRQHEHLFAASKGLPGYVDVRGDVPADQWRRRGNAQYLANGARHESRILEEGLLLSGVVK